MSKEIFIKVSKADCDRFLSAVQDCYPFSTFNFIPTKQDDVTITSYCLDDLAVGQCVKPSGKRAEYYINPFWKEA